MISKGQFVRIIDKMRLVYDFVEETNDKARQLRDDLDGSFSDFFEGNSLFIAHDNLVIELLENMFNDNDIISWWIYDEDFGRKFKAGDLSFKKNGKIYAPDLSNTEKLYDYLVEEMDKNIKLD